MKTPYIVLETIYLRSLRREDLGEEYLSWLNEPEVSRWIETGLFPTTPDDLVRFYESVTRDPNQVVFAICDSETDAHIGNVKLGPISWVHRRATLGILIGNKAFWGRGLGAAATRAAVEYAFDRLDLRRVDLGVYADHAAAIRSYEKVGFQVEGRLREDMYRDGSYRDRLWMGLLKSEYKREERS